MDLALFSTSSARYVWKPVLGSTRTQCVRLVQRSRPSTVNWQSSLVAEPAGWTVVQAAIGCYWTMVTPQTVLLVDTDRQLYAFWLLHTFSLIFTSPLISTICISLNAFLQMIWRHDVAQTYLNKVLVLAVTSMSDSPSGFVLTRRHPLRVYPLLTFYSPATLTLTWWPSYMNLTRIVWRYTGCANMNFLRQVFWKLSS